MSVFSVIYASAKQVVTRKPLTQEQLAKRMMKNPTKFFEKYNVDMAGEFKDKDIFISVLENIKKAKNDAKKILFKMSVKRILLKILQPIKNLVSKITSFFNK